MSEDEKFVADLQRDIDRVSDDNMRSILTRIVTGPQREARAPEVQSAEDRKAQILSGN